LKEKTIKYLYKKRRVSLSFVKDNYNYFNDVTKLFLELYLKVY